VLGDDEKRDYIRMEMDCPMTFCVQGEGERHQGTARDLSSSGLSILTEHTVPVGTMLEVNVTPGQQLVPPLEAVVEVVRVQQAGTGVELGTVIRKFGA